MRNFIKHHPWKIIEDRFNPENHQVAESIFSIGNGLMGQRANFEETYSGKSLQGSYLAGIYYPDKTKVGWWKNGYPTYFAKVLNAPNWIDLKIYFDDYPLDLTTWRILDFERVLDMKKGLLHRHCIVEHAKGVKLEIQSTRLCHYQHHDLGIMRYQIKVLNHTTQIRIESSIDGDVMNEDANYDEQFWHRYHTSWQKNYGQLQATTKKSGFVAQYTVAHTCQLNAAYYQADKRTTQEKKVTSHWTLQCSPNDQIILDKFVSIHTSFTHPDGDLSMLGLAAMDAHRDQGYEDLLDAHCHRWLEKWDQSDIRIEGDISAQQGIRFNIFQLNQTYTGEDARLNIGPKGFTGEKYGGSTYWDTEAYCLPFYLATAPPAVAKNLLLYRYRHLAKAIENAEKLGFKDGAALYPMVTMTGEECHNEWEITFEEIHRNGAIAHAIKDFIDYTGDEEYMPQYGLEILVAIARFWTQRAHFSVPKQQYVIHGVTGPNEYENNINNNWYTNYIARWCLDYARTQWLDVSQATRDRLQEELHLHEDEPRQWQIVANQIYLPEDTERGIKLQQEGFLDKEIRSTDTINKDDLPLNQHWSWDRILRSCFIKQADVLQGLYLFEQDFTKEDIEQNFEFYEPMTVHESSLSPCVHAILAASIGHTDKAYQMYLRTARLDLDDYNNDTEDGCHITSMAGTWMSIIKGFAGLRWYGGHLSFTPQCPKEWDSFHFKINYQGRPLAIEINKSELNIINQGPSLTVQVNQELVDIGQGELACYKYADR